MDEATALADPAPPPPPDHRILHEAILAATTLHEGQTDLSGEPYILHPLRVMLAVHGAGYPITHQVVAVLHDVVEDCDCTPRELAIGFGEEIAQAVLALTKGGRILELAGAHRQLPVAETYHEFIQRVRTNPIARIVKHYDAVDNLSRTMRLFEVDPMKAVGLRKRYKSAVRNLRVEPWSQVATRLRDSIAWVDDDPAS